MSKLLTSAPESGPSQKRDTGMQSGMIGDPQYVHRHLFVPWYCVIGLLVFGDWILGTNETIRWSRYIMIALIAFLDVLYQARAKPLGSLHVSGALVGLALLSCTWIYVQESSVFAGAFLPLSGLLYCLVFVVRSVRVAFFVSLPFMLVCGLMVYGVITTEGFDQVGWNGFVRQLRRDTSTRVPAELVHGIACLLLSWCGLMVFSRMPFGSIGRLKQHRPRAVQSSNPEFFLTKLGKEEGKGSIFNAAQQFEVKRFRSYFRWRLLLSMTLLVVFFIVLIHSLAVPLWLHIGGGLALLSLIVLCLMIPKVEELERLYLISFLACFILLIAWGFCCHQIGPLSPLSLAGYYVLMLGLCCYPVPLSYSIGLSAMVLLSGMITLPMEPCSVEGPLVIVTTLLFMHLSRRHYQEFVSQSLVTLITRKVDILAQDARSLVEGLLGLSCMPAECDRVVLIGEAGESRLLFSDGSTSSCHVDASSQRGFVYHLEDEGGDQGWLASKHLPEQLQLLISRWFISSPGQLFYLRVRQLGDSGIKDHILLIPYTFAGMLHGSDQVTRMWVTLVGAIRAFLISAPESRLQENLGLVITESQSSADVNEVVHYVNNAVQNLSISCERLVSLLDTTEGEDAAQNPMRHEIDAIGRQSRLLAVRVTDVKLLDELLKQQNKGRLECMSVQDLVNDLEDFFLLLRRERDVFTLTVAQDALSESIEVASREYLLTALRSYAFAGWKLAQPSKGTMEFRIYHDGDWVIVALHDTILRIEIDEKQAITKSASALRTGNLRVDSMRALRNLSRLSEGEFVFAVPSAEYLNRLELRFSLAAVIPETPTAQGNWTLLVDDSPEVLTFYSRVAQALRLPFETADDVSSALALIEQKGCPKFVVTDLQLKSSSGLDLVKEMRSRFSDQVPVVVVSGGASDQVIQHVHELGATRFLRKPVGRRRLFKEFQQLSGQG